MTSQNPLAATATLTLTLTYKLDGTVATARSARKRLECHELRVNACTVDVDQSGDRLEPWATRITYDHFLRPEAGRSRPATVSPPPTPRTTPTACRRPVQDRCSRPHHPVDPLRRPLTRPPKRTIRPTRHVGHASGPVQRQPVRPRHRRPIIAHGPTRRCDPGHCISSP